MHGSALAARAPLSASGLPWVTLARTAHQFGELPAGLAQQGPARNSKKPSNNSTAWTKR